MFGLITWFVFAVLAVGFFRPATAEPDIQTIVERSIATNEADWRDEPSYDHWERDDSGDEAKTYQVLMIDGTPYERLVAIKRFSILCLDCRRHGHEKLHRSGITGRRDAG